MNYDVIIIGAGAAGLMCAIEAGKRGRKVLVLDKAKAAGEKIRISGGGRCNFTNIHTTPANYLSQNPYFCVSALKRYGPQDFIALVEKHGITYHEKTLGQLFCDGSSMQIVNMLLAECRAMGVSILLNTSVTKLHKTESGFSLELSDGSICSADSIVIATGGPSIPKMGSTGWGYEIAKQFGLAIVPPRAGLVPFTLSQPPLELAGISLDVTTSCRGVSFKEGLLFTHKGLSGPAILQISSYWQEGDQVNVDFAPGKDALTLLKDARHTSPKQEIHTALSQFLPKKLARFLASEDASKKLADCSNAILEKIASYVHAFLFTPNGTEGYRTAEVTLGGVSTDELSSTTFEAKKVKGLYFIGEIVDVTGHLGGFNFQWAWASGHAAGRCV